MHEKHIKLGYANHFRSRCLLNSNSLAGCFKTEIHPNLKKKNFSIRYKNLFNKKQDHSSLTEVIYCVYLCHTYLISTS